jgi:PAS domain S-box-containing protein
MNGPLLHTLRGLARRLGSRLNAQALARENAALQGELQSTLTAYRSLIERLPAVTYLDDFETGDTEFISPQVTALFGVTPEQWMADPDAWLGPIHPDDRDRVSEAYVAAIAAREPLRVEYRVLSPDGVVRWVVDQTVILPQVDGRRTLTQGLIIDISDGKRAEQELTHRANHDQLTALPNRHRFRMLLDDAIAAAKRSGRAVAVL